MKRPLAGVAAAVLLPLFLCLAGCAGARVSPVAYRPVPEDPARDDSSAARKALSDSIDDATRANRAADDAANGIRYYETSPYLLVHSDGKGGIVWKILYLPDQTKKRTIDPYNFWAKLDTSFTFRDGVLTDSNVAADATAVPKAIIGAVQAFVSAGTKILSKPSTAGAPDVPAVPGPALYKIVFDGQTVRFIGSDGAIPTNVTITKG